MDEASPRFVQHSGEEAARHTSYLLVTTVPWPSAKGSFHTTIEWHTAGGAAGNGNAGAGEPTARVRTLVEREPLDVKQARDKAENLARRYSVPVVLVVAR